MNEALSLAGQNLLSPMVMFFALGFAAAMARSDLSVPDAVAKAMALYLMLAIGFKGGVELSRQGFGGPVPLVLLAGMILSAVLPLIAFAGLRLLSPLRRADAAAVAAHYGSISVVTFVAGTEFLRALNVPAAGYMVAVMALMETPAIVTGLILARHGARMSDGAVAARPLFDRRLVREVFLNGSVVLLVGAFLVGWATGDRGREDLAPFIDAPFKGVLCLFLLDMGLVAAQRLREARGMGAPTLAFGIALPLINASIGLAVAVMIGLGPGEATLLAVLAGSASYIAVPAAMRLALPEASPSIYLTLSLAITFPFNLAVGIPLYHTAAVSLVGG